MEYMTGVLRGFASGLMYPVFLVLLLLIVFVVWALGALIVEYFTERRHFKATLPDAINALEDAPVADLNEVICSMQLLWTQKRALLLVANNGGLPEDALFSLAKGEVTTFEERYQRMVGRTDLLAKVAPMVGLMCTLIPLGPGIVAMGEGKLELLSSSLGVAFDGTVVGLVAAVLAMLISYLRRRWYGRYSASMEALMATLLEKIGLAKAKGASFPSHFTSADVDALRDKAKQMALTASNAAKAVGESR